MLRFGNAFPVLIQMLTLEKRNRLQKFLLMRDEFAFSRLRLIFEYVETESLICSFKMRGNTYEEMLVFTKTDTPPETYLCLKTPVDECLF